MALRPGEPPYANYDNDNDEDEDEDENENAVDDDGFPLILRRARVLLATNGTSSSRRPRRGHREQYDHPSAGLSAALLPRSHHRLSLPPRLFSRPAGLATRPHRQSSLRGLSPPDPDPPVASSPPLLLNFQTDLSPYSEIVLPPLLARAPGPHPGNPFPPFIRPHRLLSVLRHRSLSRVNRGAARPDGPTGSWRRYHHVSSPPSGRCLPPPAGAKRGNHPARVAVQLVAAALPFKLLIRVKDRVVFTGFLTGEPLARAYAVGDLFQHCSITETFGLVVLEAMAGGVPVVARDCGGPSDIVCRETGYLEDPNDVNRFAQRILQVLSDPDLRARLSIAARQFAQDTT
ncbi:hypothetical protein V8E54_008858 [Elaphomyces granulatus]